MDVQRKGRDTIDFSPVCAVVIKGKLLDEAQSRYIDANDPVNTQFFFLYQNPVEGTIVPGLIGKMVTRPFNWYIDSKAARTIGTNNEALVHIPSTVTEKDFSILYRTLGLLKGGLRVVK